MVKMIAELTDLLAETGQAHHQAFIESDGFDPEWPFWYADYLLDKLPPQLEAKFTRSELAHLLEHLSKIQPAEAPGASWSGYYARYLVERYL